MSPTSMQGKICLITGGNAGLGFETAHQLAKRGAELILVCRSRQKGEEAKQRLIQETGNPAVTVLLADLSVIDQIKTLSDEVHARFKKIDVLINNAGAVFSKFELTADGLEKTIATNHFSYFLLTNYLLDLLSASDYARILNVSSNGHFSANIDFESFTARKGYNLVKAYGQSKLANILFTHELADRLKNTHITINAISPGRVTTQIGYKNQAWYVSLGWRILMSLRSVSVEEGARTYVYLATSDEVKGVSGKYFHECKVKKPSKLSQNKALAEQLWRETERLAGVQFRPLQRIENKNNTQAK